MSAQHRLSDETVCDYLRGRGLLAPGQPAGVETAGQGNINWVRRVRPASGPALIVKQARPALERFPEYRVSTERIVCEARYYERVRSIDVARVCPAVLDFDESEKVLVLEDLGDAELLERALARGEPCVEAAARLGSFLGAVHAATRTSSLGLRFDNEEMRRLHGAHIFELPLRPNDFPLSPSLRRRAEQLWQDAELVAIADAAHHRYLGCAEALVHADAQGTNILLTPCGARLVDAEIAHHGDPAFDLGVLLAHLLLPAAARRERGRALPALESGWSAYCARLVDPPDFEAVACYAGLELLRRTIGAARVPAAAEDAAAHAILDVAERVLRDPGSSPESLACA